MNKLDLTALLERVRNATGQDRELDADLLEMAGIGYYDYTRSNYEYQTDESNRMDLSKEWTQAFPTASIDAALALVERVLSGSNDGPLLYARAGYWNADASNGRNYLQTFHVAIGAPPALVEMEADGVTEPLAILTALLLALTSNQEGNDEA